MGQDGTQSPWINKAGKLQVEHWSRLSHTRQAASEHAAQVPVIVTGWVAGQPPTQLPWCMYSPNWQLRHTVEDEQVLQLGLQGLQMLLRG